MPGVGNVSVFGVGQYSMRIWLDPQTLQARGLTPQDVINVDPAAEPAGDRRPGRRAAGAGGQDSSTPSTSRAGSTDPAEFGNIIVKVDSANGGQITRVKDVGAGRTGRADLLPGLHG